MAFNNSRQYSTAHGMTPTVQASKGAAGAPGAASIPSGGQGGSAANDLAALGGMGAVGAGLLGKFMYDKYNKGQMDAANLGNEMYESTAPGVGSPNEDVLGGLAANSGGVVYEPGQAGLNGFNDTPGEFAQQAASDSGGFNLFGSGKAGDAELNLVSPLAKPLGLDDTLAGMQDKLGFDPITGIWGKVF